MREGAEHLGFLSLMGQCFEPDRALPYAPWLDILRTRYTQSVPEQSLHALAQDVGPNVPELARLLPGLMPQPPEPVPPSPDPGATPSIQQRRFVHALVQFFACAEGSRARKSPNEPHRRACDQPMRVLYSEAEQGAEVVGVAVQRVAGWCEATPRCRTRPRAMPVKEDPSRRRDTPVIAA